MAVKIVTDSTCDLPRDLVETWGIDVIPLTVRFGSQSYRDGVDLTADEFFKKLTGGSVLPTTAAPPPGAFAEAYRKALSQGHDVLSLHISSKLSATYGSALIGKDEAGAGKPIEVVDTFSVSMGLGMLALEAARAARQGAGLAELTAMVKKLIPAVRLYGAFDTLEYLVKGGRIGKARAIVGSLLDLKPIISVQDGEVHSLERVRTRGRAVKRLVDLVSAAKPKEIVVIHATTPGERDDLEAQIRTAVPGVATIRAQFGPVLGTYTGPGILGVVFLKESEGPPAR